MHKLDGEILFGQQQKQHTHSHSKQQEEDGQLASGRAGEKKIFTPGRKKTHTQPQQKHEEDGQQLGQVTTEAPKYARDTLALIIFFV